MRDRPSRFVSPASPVGRRARPKTRDSRPPALIRRSVRASAMRARPHLFVVRRGWRRRTRRLCGRRRRRRRICGGVWRWRTRMCNNTNRHSGPTEEGLIFLHPLAVMIAIRAGIVHPPWPHLPGLVRDQGAAITASQAVRAGFRILVEIRGKGPQPFSNLRERHSEGSPVTVCKPGLARGRRARPKTRDSRPPALIRRRVRAPALRAWPRVFIVRRERRRRRRRGRRRRRKR